MQLIIACRASHRIKRDYRCFLGDALECHREHQFDAVELIDFAGARVVVDGRDVGFGEAFAQRFDHALAGDVIGQAGKWLQTQDVRDARFDEFDHFGGEEPAFAGIVAFLQEIVGYFGEFVDGGRRFEMGAGAERLECRCLIVFDDADCRR